VESGPDTSEEDGADMWGQAVSETEGKEHGVRTQLGRGRAARPAGKKQAAWAKQRERAALTAELGRCLANVPEASGGEKFIFQFLN